MKKILCLCFSPTFQKTITFEKVTLEKVNRSLYYRMDASGKAVNSARVLAQLEKDCVYTFCPLGKNDSAKFVELAKKDNLQLSYVEIDGGIRECCTLLDKAKDATTELVVGEPDLQRTKEFIESEKQLLLKVEELIKSVDGVLLAGSRPKVWADDIYAKIAELSIKHNKIFLADFIGNDLMLTLEKCTPTIIKINDEEFCKTFGMTFVEDSTENDDYENKLKAAIVEKSQQLQNLIIVTRGTKPTFAGNKGEFASCPVEKLKPVNTTACGDSFNAGFLYDYLNNQNFESALKKGTWCAARNAENECPGTTGNLR